MRSLSRPRSATDKLIRAALHKVPANCAKLDSRDPMSQFEAVKVSLSRIQMRLEKARKAGNDAQTRVLSDLKGKAIENLQRLAVEVSRYQDGAQAVSDRHNPRDNASWKNDLS
jgi:hypothetical protein